MWKSSEKMGDVESNANPSLIDGDYYNDKRRITIANSRHTNSNMIGMEQIEEKPNEHSRLDSVPDTNSMVQYEQKTSEFV